MKNKLNIIDLFAGCGGLLDGFEKTKAFNTLACVEWESAPCKTLISRLKNKWGYSNAEKIVLRFDIQRTKELFSGWENDPIYGSSIGLDKLIGKKKVDFIIGGPPCQAYSIAGRVRDKNGMREDYRNFLFESYLEIVKKYTPKAFVFENVQGILSAKPKGMLIIEEITKAFSDSGYILYNNLKKAVFDVADFGIPQHRKRIIILGIRKDIKNAKEKLNSFYKDSMKRHIEKIPATVDDAIGDLPKLFPLNNDNRSNAKASHSISNFPNHTVRFHNQRDISIFRTLAEDIENNTNNYVSPAALKELYFKMTGKRTNIHKYNVLRRNAPSNTIPAHLYKDGLRHIHPDSKQARSITVREAARLQTFDDDFIFQGSMGDNFKMIGNAVPPKFSNIIACSLLECFK